MEEFHPERYLVITRRYLQMHGKMEMFIIRYYLKQIYPEVGPFQVSLCGKY